LPIDRAVGGAIDKPLAAGEQAQVELMLLATGLRHVPAADIGNGLLPPQRRARLGQVPARQQRPGVVGFRNGQQRADRLVIGRILEGHWTEDHISVRVLFEERDLRRDLIR
jgi:hypothetical protein